jgi:hypothetical protein
MTEDTSGGSPAGLSPEDIAAWAGKLGFPGDGARLAEIIHDAFCKIEKFNTVSRSIRPSTVRMDKLLPQLADQAEEIKAELDQLPGDVTAALTIRFEEYLQTVANLRYLSLALWSVGKTWVRPSPGAPALSRQASALVFLIDAIERFTGQPFPSSRATKRPDTDKIELAKLLAQQSYPEATPANIRTMLRHVDEYLQARRDRTAHRASLRPNR